MSETHLLSYLDAGTPEVLRFDSVTVVAHLIVDDKLNNENLLQQCTVHHLKTTKNNSAPFMRRSTDYNACESVI